MAQSGDSMRTSDRGIVEIIGHEGIALTKYNDMVGKGYTIMPGGKKRRGTLTIGAGLTKTEIPDLAQWPWQKEISMSEAMELKLKALKRYEDALNDAIKVKIPQHVFDALVSWCYNVGVGWTGKFGHPQATLIKRLNRGESLKRVAEALMRFKKPRAIIGRRKKEAKLLEHGIYSNDGKAALIPVSMKGYPMYRQAKTINVWDYIEKAKAEKPEPAEVHHAVEASLDIVAEQERPLKNKMLDYLTDLLDKLK